MNKTDNNIITEFKALNYYIDKLKKNNLSYKLIGAVNDLANVKVLGLAYDSRSVKPGYVFFGLIGQNQDGNKYIDQAILNGATCVISEIQPNKQYNLPYLVVDNIRLVLALFSHEFYGKPGDSLNLIGITGTNGKTTTTHLLESLVSNFGIIGTLGARFRQSDIDSDNYQVLNFTTPFPPELHQVLNIQRANDIKTVAMEVSSHALSLDRVAYLDFNIACLTNITQDHLDFHKTMENYVNAKFKLFENLINSPKKNKFAILNKDSIYGHEFESRLQALNPHNHDITILTYGFNQDSSLFVKNYTNSFDSTTIHLNGILGEFSLTIPVIGVFNIYNVLSAILIAYALDIDKNLIIDQLKNFKGVPGRFERVSSGNEPLCIVDYAHTPDGLANVLKAARELTPKSGKLIVVFGCGGDRDSSKRPQMGAIAEELADSIIVTSDNPRSEDPEQIIADILAGIKKLKTIHVEKDRSAAIKLAISQANTNDVVVIAGKGHENYQIIGNETRFFDDRKEARENLRLKTN